jgi:hypothetical protein
MEEIWKDIKGYEGYYQVSNLGRVKSLNRYVKYPNGSLRLFKEKILCQYIMSNGYYTVCLAQVKKKVHLVHRLICKTFLKNTEEKRTVNHINGIKTDNNLMNLEWCSYSENQKHAHRLGLSDTKGEKNAASKLTEQQAKEIKYGHKGLTQTEIAKIYGIDRRTVSNIRLEKRWKHI